MQDAHSLAVSIASGRTSAPEVMQATLEAATARAGMGATLGIDAEQAMAAAREAKRRYTEWRNRLETRELSRIVLDKHGSRKKTPMRRPPARPENRQGDLFL